MSTRPKMVLHFGINTHGVAPTVTYADWWAYTGDYKINPIPFERYLFLSYFIISVRRFIYSYI